VDLLAFGRALSELTIDDIRAIAHDLATASVSTADEVGVTRSVLVIEQTLRRTHRLPNAAAAALAAATTVQEVAHRARVALPDNDVTRVARAAAQLARGLVVGESPGVEDALRCLGKGWHRLPCCADLAAA
jgi:hypothetical protein